ncbi:flagellar biosynthesis protein FlhB [Pleionea sp. CnH1-48]|uniref:flagellar biosynthesis protein FlhB n=1 Tax=Pleionea sp. CnH1-48 TaxID=2954494 RepID=UPI002097A858|nr:flagellar biosynthesis protein FlhB [Pleionea sp. CnH1-48]MCO7226102.1 flagellar biosynthesis protein FlhB [Pleionea sp. CnH1-48]
MAENDAGERSEEATPRKREKAKEKGQVPRSKELNTALILMAAALALMLTTFTDSKAFTVITDMSFELEREQIFDERYMLATFAESLRMAMTTFAPFFLLLFFTGVMGSVLMGGVSLSAQAVMPKGSRLSPMAGFKRMFGMNALMELLKAIGKVLIVGTVALLVMHTSFDDYLKLGQSNIEAEAMEATKLILFAFLMVSVSLVLIALIDVPFQIWNHAKQLRMTKQEVKDEYKETEGKPEVKSRIRQMQRELTHRRMMEAIPEADVVVTNPEHFSVALKYDQQGQTAPIVVARGVDEVAFNIRKVASAHDVTILEAPPLARALFYTTKLDQEIPSELYLAVAQVLAYVFQLQAYKKGQGPMPTQAREYPIPESMKY